MPNDVSTFLPDVELRPLSTLTVTVDQAAATLGYMNVHGDQSSPDDVIVPLSPVTGAYTQGDSL